MKKIIYLILIISLFLTFSVTADEESEEEESGVGFMFSIITIIFGIIALVWTYSARNKLAKGSSLRQYISNFLIALLLIVGSSVWHFIREVTPIGANLGHAAEYPEYIMIILAFLVFVLAAYQMKFISEEFNFEDQTSEMKKALDKGAKPKVK
ncbi:MAG: hypothetical protein ABII01_03400 [Candidatus Woesearchaeota archaeon]